MAVYGKVDHGRHRQSYALPRTARNSAKKTHHVLYFQKRISKTTWDHMGTTWGQLWDRLGHYLKYHLEHSCSWASSGTCLGPRLWGMTGTSSGACLGQSKISAVLHASLMPFFTPIHCYAFGKTSWFWSQKSIFDRLNYFSVNLIYFIIFNDLGLDAAFGPRTPVELTWCHSGVWGWIKKWYKQTHYPAANTITRG